MGPRAKPEELMAATVEGATTNNKNREIWRQCVVVDVVSECACVARELLKNDVESLWQLVKDTVTM